MIGEGSSKRICQEDQGGGDHEDRISNLPENVIDYILDCMPIRDAARASSLSRKWRHIWTGNPHLVFDKQFMAEIKKNKSFNLFLGDYVNIVNRILLQHEGAIPEFALNFPVAEIHSSNADHLKIIYSNIDLWLLFLTRKGVRKLTLENSNSVPYKLPSYVFACPKLTDLTISKCIFRAPNSFKGFSKLTNVILDGVTFELSVVISFPQLVLLAIRNCQGIRFLDISAPLLQKLALYNNSEFELSNYVNCKYLVSAYFTQFLEAVVPNKRKGDHIRLTTVLDCWPLLSRAYLDGFALKCLTAGFVRNKLPTRIKCLKHLVLFRIKFDLDEISCILCLLPSASNLRNLEIRTGHMVSNEMTVADYLEESAGRVNQPALNRLKTVKMKWFKGSKVEVLLVKHLLAISPLLEKMYIEENQKVDPSATLKIAKELIQLSRTSPKAQIFFQPMLKEKCGSV